LNDGKLRKFYRDVVFCRLDEKGMATRQGSVR
jgi:hypothetical protein